MQPPSSLLAAFFAPALRRLRLISRCLALAATLVFGLVSLGSLQAQSIYNPNTIFTSIDGPGYMDHFEYSNGSTSSYWNVTSGPVTSANGNVTYTFSDGQTGHASTMVWAATGELISWNINLGSGGAVSYADGASSGHLGDFVRQSSSTALGNVTEINDAEYQMSGSYLTPSLNCYDPSYLATFTYKGTTYQQPTTLYYDYQWRAVAKYADGTRTISSTADLRAYPEQLAVGFADGTVAKYLGPGGVTYNYRPSSTAANKLTKLNGYALTVNGDANSLPQPPINRFVWNGNAYLLDCVDWQQPPSSTFGAPLRLVYFYYSDTASFAGTTYSPNGNPFGDICSASVNPNGAFAYLWVEDDPTGNGTMEEDATLTGGPAAYTINYPLGACSFSSINGHTCTTSGSTVTIASPVSSFKYSGQTYQSQGTTPNTDGTATTAYVSTGGSTATVRWNPSTYQADSLQIKPYGNGSVASYVNGEAVGRPGTYVWDGDSSAGNLLQQVNLAQFTDSGGAALPTGGYVNQSGIFDILSNLLSIGQWSNDANHVGFSLSYDDGEPVTVPASVEFTASRPSTSWLWTAAAADGASANYVMQVDGTSRLMLYPPPSNAIGAPAVPSPTVVLDPNPGGISRFDGPVRIAPQGDLSMGAFTSEPAAQ